jgi:putative transposase
MLHSYTKLYVHLVWTIKNRDQLFGRLVQQKIRQHLVEYAKTNDIIIIASAIQIEHVHLLINLNSNQQVDNIVKLLKGESSHWINSENLIRPKFSWQRGYGAFTISLSQIDVVKKYINHQDEHHQKISFTEEWQKILLKYGFNL